MKFVLWRVTTKSEQMRLAKMLDNMTRTSKKHLRLKALQALSAHGPNKSKTHNATNKVSMLGFEQLATQSSFHLFSEQVERTQSWDQTQLGTDESTSMGGTKC